MFMFELKFVLKIQNIRAFHYSRATNYSQTNCQVVFKCTPIKTVSSPVYPTHLKTNKENAV